MYAASQEGASTGPEANAEATADGGDDNVSDVEFEEVEDKDK
jgi:hypothetical protein